MIVFWVLQTLLAAAVLGLLIAAWVIGRRPRESAGQKPSPGRRTAIILLRVQTFLLLPLFILDSLIAADPTQQRFLTLQTLHWFGTIILYTLFLGEVLTVPVIWMWVRYGQGKNRVIGVSASVLCALLILLLVMVAGATA